MESGIGLVAAFGGGLISFFAPCAAVLVPAFLLHLAGVEAVNPSGPEAARYRRPVLLHTLAFVLGFWVVFVLLGASLGLLSQGVKAHQVWLARVGGSIIILFGLFQLGLLRFGLLERERAFRVAPGRFKYFGSAVVGSTFAIAWSPCVGPILGAILVLAGVSASAQEGALLLSAYSAGLMLPFVLTGVFIGWASSFLGKVDRYLPWVQRATGVLLVVLGIIVFTGRFTQLVGYLFFLGQ
ncbi:MAG: cytochrome c biogenesis CcdA family protein [Dehalococcoidia bacterium]